MKKNDEIVISITDINNNGLGVGKYEGFVFFVANSAPGDLIRMGVTSIKKNYGYGRIIEIISPSENRVDSICKLGSKCGGCSLLHISYPAQLRIKEKQVKNALIRIGGFDEEYINRATTPIIGMDEPYHYRNKAQYPVSIDENGRVKIGLYAKRSHRVVETENCYIGQKSDKKILDAVGRWINTCNIPIYREKEGKGLIRHILIRHGTADEIMVCLISADKNIPHIEKLIKELSIMDNIKTVCINVNDSRGNIILGRKTFTAWGTGSINDRFTARCKDKSNSIEVRISPESFYQINHSQMEKLYQIAMEYLELNGRESVWDIYCGIGTITLALSGFVRQALGIEEVEAAIKDAKENAQLNNIENVSFYCGKAESILTDNSIFQKFFTPDIILLDPPRAGCDLAVLNAILKASPQKILYIRCNP